MAQINPHPENRNFAKVVLEAEYEREAARACGLEDLVEVYLPSQQASRVCTRIINMTRTISETRSSKDVDRQ